VQLARELTAYCQDDVQQQRDAEAALDADNDWRE